MRRTLVLLVLAAAALLCAPGSALGAFGIKHWEVEVLDAAGEPVTQAGEHPDKIVTYFETTSKPAEPFGETTDGSPKDVKVDLPVGFVGNGTSLPTCTNQQLSTRKCPDAAQIGQVRVRWAFQSTFTFAVPLYNVEPPPGMPAQFAFYTPVVVHFNVSVRPDNGITIEAPNTNQSLPLVGAEVTVWGVPSSPSHDYERGLPASGTCADGSPAPCPVGLPPKANLTMPTECVDGEPLRYELSVNSWQEPDNVQTATQTTPPLEGCERLPFAATASVEPEARSAGAPTGLEVELKTPQSQAPENLGTAHLRDVTVTLPEGMTVNAASAGGLAGCTPQQIALGTNDSPACPQASRLGTVSIDTPLLAAPLAGDVYLATQGTNPFASLLAMYVAVDDPKTGITLKMPGRVSPDPQTGRLTATFQNNPQLPFETLRMSLKGGSRAALKLPDTCGTYSTRVEMTSWAMPDEVVAGESSFTVDQNCAAAGQFTPGLEAGSSDPVGGNYSPFTLRITRPDGQRNVSAISATLPEGLLAKLKGVPLCADAQAATGECPAASQVGTSTVGAGAGTSPIYVPQPGKAPTGVYLAGPYKGAPYSLVVKVPAQAGPFDLGTVAVRNALHVDPVTTQVTAASDPLPQILQGIPIAYRDIRVDVDRGDFTVNPTSCEPMSVTSTIAATGGASASPSAHFQATDCNRLGFGPQLNLKLKGKTKRSAYQQLRAELKAKPGQANIGRATVTIPPSIFLAQEHIKTVCTRAQSSADACPKGSIYGRARAITPLLDKPLEGNVYLRANGGARELPDLVADLRGQIDIELVGYIDSVNGGIRTRFQNVPDAPVSKFVLNMKGGKKSLLVSSANLCRSDNRATVKMDGQNGKVHDFKPQLKVSCGKKR